MSNWSDRPLCAFDLETTGPDPASARIVSACVAMVEPSSPAVRQARTWLVDPGIPIPDGASRVHGITTEKAQAEGLVYLDGYTQIRSALHEAWEAGTAVVAFNAAYDLTVIDAEGHRLGFPPLAPPLVVDPYVIDRERDRFRRGKRTLSDVARHYGVRLDNSHEAQADAVAAAHLVSALLTKFPDIAKLDIMAAQSAWHSERQRGFADYLRRNGRDASDVNAEWPMRTAHRV